MITMYDHHGALWDIVTYFVCSLTISLSLFGFLFLSFFFFSVLHLFVCGVSNGMILSQPGFKLIPS